MAKPNPNLLLVEGKDEQYTLPFFMDEYVVWEDEKKNRVVEIKELGGVEELLRPGLIEAESKTPGLHALGVILDANESFELRGCACVIDSGGWRLMSPRICRQPVSSM